VKTKQHSTALALLLQIPAQIANLPPSRWGVYAQVNFAESWMKLGNRGVPDSAVVRQNLRGREQETDNRKLASLLARAVTQARELNDPRAESYALGQLGHLYERTTQWSEALTLTQQALSLAQGTQADDIAAIWQWQQGRILKAQADIKGAIAAYEQAVKTLESLRQDLVLMNPDVQFSFRDEVEPVYRQLVQLLLQNVDSLPETTQQQHLEQSRKTIEALQLAELENFFREACLSYKPRRIDQIDSTAAVIYPILLERRLEVIVSLPEQPLQHYGTDLSPDEESRVFDELRQSLNPAFLASEVLPPAQKLYNWLLRPAQQEIERQGIKTLVFVLDGFLRSLPMAVLHDGKQYLVEKYNLALTPSLQLLESPHLASQQFNVLIGGLSEARQGFSALPGVKQEIEQIAAYVSTRSLFNENFTRPNVQKQIEAVPFSVVHL
ncbi:MAG: CHAT domain-containing protein, partial [Microcystaceae cyanobacterium]